MSILVGNTEKFPYTFANLNKNFKIAKKIYSKALSIASTGASSSTASP